MQLTQFEQFELLYKQIFAVSSEVKALIDEQNYDEILSKEAYKSQLISKISVIENSISLSNEEIGIIENYKKKICLQEKENLDRIQYLRDETLSELNNQIGKEKVFDKYEPVEFETGSICDYTSD